MIFGSITAEFEQMLAEGAGLIGGPNLSRRQPHKKRSRLVHFSMQDVRFVRYSVRYECIAKMEPIFVSEVFSSKQTATFGELFLAAIKNHNVLCFGLYRKILGPDEKTKPSRSLRRYVVTVPPKDFLLQSDDKIFAIERVNFSLSW